MDLSGGSHHNPSTIQETQVSSVGKIPCRRKWQPLLTHGQRSLAGYTAHGVAKSRTPLTTNTCSFFSYRDVYERFIWKNWFMQLQGLAGPNSIEWRRVGWKLRHEWVLPSWDSWSLNCVRHSGWKTLGTDTVVLSLKSRAGWICLLQSWGRVPSSPGNLECVTLL